MRSKIVRLTGFISTVLFCAAFTGTPALAADEVVPLDIATEMATPDASASLDGSVKFYYGQAAHPAVLKQFGEYVSNQKAGFLKSNSIGCHRAFVDALTDLQNRAKAYGGNGVVRIRSYYRKKVVDIGTTVPCHPSGLRVGITLKGEIVSLAQ